MVTKRVMMFNIEMMEWFYIKMSLKSMVVLNTVNYEIMCVCKIVLLFFIPYCLAQTKYRAVSIHLYGLRVIKPIEVFYYGTAPIGILILRYIQHSNIPREYVYLDRIISAYSFNFIPTFYSIK